MNQDEEDGLYILIILAVTVTIGIRVGVAFWPSLWAIIPGILVGFFGAIPLVELERRRR